MAPRFAFAPRAVAHFRPRGSVRAFWHQYFRYARGDGKAGLFARRHAIRYATYAGLLAFFLGGWRYRALWLLLLPAAGAYVRRPYARLLPALGTLAPRDRARALLLVPLSALSAMARRWPATRSASGGAGGATGCGATGGRSGLSATIVGFLSLRYAVSTALHLVLRQER